MPLQDTDPTPSPGGFGLRRGRPASPSKETILRLLDHRGSFYALFRQSAARKAYHDNELSIASGADGTWSPSSTSWPTQSAGADAVYEVGDAG